MARGPAPGPAGLRRQLGLLILDIGAPIGLYYGLHGAGVSNLVALGAGRSCPPVGVIVQLITRRRLDGVGGVVVVSVLATIALSLITDDARFGTVSWDGLWDTDPAFRRIWRVSTLMWGVGLLVDAALRVLMSYTLPVAVVPGLGGALWPVTFIVLQVVTNVYYHRAGLYRILGAPFADARRDRSAHESTRAAVSQAASSSAGRGA